MFSGKQILSLIFWILICFIPAVVGSRFMPGEWYARLAKPSWTPPGYLFGPVWTFLYATMGISAWLLWKKVGFSGTKIAFAFFFALMILATLIAFWKLYQPSGIILIPYLAWVSFAAALNFSIWFLNKPN
jgi:tryptophan-rich sensory protein